MTCGEEVWKRGLVLTHPSTPTPGDAGDWGQARGWALPGNRGGWRSVMFGCARETGRACVSQGSCKGKAMGKGDGAD
nr:hypothetical protein CFP56_65525 [Quercus suber]